MLHFARQPIGRLPEAPPDCGLELRGLAKSFPAPGERRVLFEGLDLCLTPGARVGLLGANGAGKSTLLAIIAGTLAPDAGTVRTRGRVSWPMGFSGGFANDLTGLQNARFVARIYGADTDNVVDFVNAFSELGRDMRLPLRAYSAGMRARLAFGLSMALGFDWYLVDEIIAAGDLRFRARAQAVFRERLAGAGLIMVSHAPAILREHCDSAVLLLGGQARYFSDLDEALEVHQRLTRTG